MRVSVFGLGYVGSVSSACFAERQHNVIGVDTNQVKVDLINSGRTPIIEPGLEKLISRAVNNNCLSAITDSENAVLKSDVSFVCVGTPSNNNGSLNTKYLENVCTDIGCALAKKNSFHVVVIRSTLLPGTMRDIVIPILEQQTGWKAGKDFGVCNNPEFLREGSAIDDFNNPSRTIISATDERSGDMVAQLYQDLPAPIVRCPIEVGEMIKYADNAWHANKITFANEIGAFCKAQNIDSHQVMDIFCRDTKLNISPSYLKPGFAFGGSCLPKDLRALTHKARSMDMKMPLLNALLESNRAQIETGLDIIAAIGKKKIGILGFSFKAGTDDLRESPMVQIIERLIGKGYDLRLYDKSVHLAKLVGANRDYIFKTIPHIERLMVDDIQQVLAHAEAIVIGNNASEFAEITEWLRLSNMSSTSSASLQLSTSMALQWPLLVTLPTSGAF
jgi:GDP-mannose 6-dehydrogenase